ncbi:MAG: hypothetical protein JSR18_10875 [Proteobacteria bacterium]|nr:hypothetical protein [Pseudomonadota bacterium]
MNGITLVALLVLAIALPIAFRIGYDRGRRTPARAADILRPNGYAAEVAAPPSPPPAAPLPPAPAVAPRAPAAADEHAAAYAGLDAERARIIRNASGETWALRGALAAGSASACRDAELAEDRRRLYRELAAARTAMAGYRQLLVELEDNAPPPLLDGPNAPDDLKLIVGVGPVLERMLQQLGITTYRQIARWSEHDIDTFDARLPEFHGRIRRDAWVTQARALHQSKYGEKP